MTDTTLTPAVPAAAAETWGQEEWALLEGWEQDAIGALHEAGMIFRADVWPAVKAGLGLFLSQLGKAIFGAIAASLANPEALPAAVGAAIVLTATTQGGADALNAISNAQSAVANDANAQAAIAAL